MLDALENWLRYLKRRYKTISAVVGSLFVAYWFIDDNLLDKRMSKAVLAWVTDLPTIGTARRALALYLLVLLAAVGGLVVRLLKVTRDARQQLLAFADYRQGQQNLIDGYKKEIEGLQAGRIIDKLTQIKNREGLEIDFPRKLSQLKPDRDVFFLAYIDIVSLKKINKEIGHELANDAMKRFASAMKLELRGQDELYRLDDGSGVYRLEGDQFVLILNNKTILEAKKGAVSINKRLQHQPIRLGKDPVTYKEIPPLRLAFRCGITDCNPEDKLKDCLARADAALKLARRDDVSEGTGESAVEIVERSDVLKDPGILKIDVPS